MLHAYAADRRNVSAEASAKKLLHIYSGWPSLKGFFGALAFHGPGPTLRNSRSQEQLRYTRSSSVQPSRMGGRHVSSLTRKAALFVCAFGLVSSALRRGRPRFHGEAHLRVAAARRQSARRRAPALSSHAAARRQRGHDLARRRRGRRLVHARAVGRDRPERQGDRAVRPARAAARERSRTRRISRLRSATPKRSSATSPTSHRTASTPQ